MQVLGWVHCGSKEGCNDHWLLTVDGFLVCLPERLPVKVLWMTVSFLDLENHLSVSAVLEEPLTNAATTTSCIDLQYYMYMYVQFIFGD